ncbi:MAG: alanine racemase [Proteobacteria bacterium]|nr:alanine racemase [Pseudomonadota bacterium]
MPAWSAAGSPSRACRPVSRSSTRAARCGPSRRTARRNGWSRRARPSSSATPTQAAATSSCATPTAESTGWSYGSTTPRSKRCGRRDAGATARYRPAGRRREVPPRVRQGAACGHSGRRGSADQHQGAADLGKPVADAGGGQDRPGPADRLSGVRPGLAGQPRQARAGERSNGGALRRQAGLLRLRGLPGEPPGGGGSAAALATDDGGVEAQEGWRPQRGPVLPGLCRDPGGWRRGNRGHRHLRTRRGHDHGRQAGGRPGRPLQPPCGRHAGRLSGAVPRIDRPPGCAVRGVLRQPDRPIEEGRAGGLRLPPLPDQRGRLRRPGRRARREDHPVHRRLAFACLGVRRPGHHRAGGGGFALRQPGRRGGADGGAGRPVGLPRKRRHEPDRRAGAGALSQRRGEHRPRSVVTRRDTVANGLAGLETPALVLDRDKLQANLARLRDHLATWPEVAFRPHLKTAKSLDVADLVSPGRGPITVSTLKEAEVFAAHGFRDIVYAVGVAPDKLPRVAALNAAGARTRVILDNLQAAAAVADFGREAGRIVPTLIEVDTDGHRGGVRPHDPVLLRIGEVLAVVGALEGVLTHAGGSYGARTPDELAAFAETERSGAVAAAERLRAAGLPSPVVSVGSTPTAFFTRDLTGVTEVRAGVYMFFDLVMAGIGVCSTEEIALSVLATVIGYQPAAGQIVVDAGWMALSRDRGTSSQPLDQGYGLVTDADGAPLGDLIVSATNQEHGLIASRSGAPIDPARFPVGSRLRILPNHACATAAQHDRYHVLAGGALAAEWPRFGQW